MIRVIVGLIIKWRLPTLSKLFTRHQNGLSSIIPREFEIYNILFDYVLWSYLSCIQTLVFSMLLFFGWFLLIFVLLRLGCRFANTFGAPSESSLYWRQARWDSKSRTTAANIDDCVFLVNDLYIIKWLSCLLIWRAILFSTFHLVWLLSYWAP